MQGFVIEQAIGELSSRGCNFEAYDFRTSDQHELDLVLDLGTERWAVEIKLTASPSPGDMGRLEATADVIGAARRFLVSQTGRSTGDEVRASCNLPGLIERFRQSGG
ncbi:MAG: hypothetical protein GEU99_04310 [Luteitalea sp.]|nr:hypothetical protein [Luteitalea sp.]